MSLLKARRIKDKSVPTLAEAFFTFQCDVDTYIAKVSEKNAIEIIDSYCNMSYIYLLETSQSLQPDEENKDKLTYMNSIVAEVCHETDIPYFHPTGAYSLIDVGVKYKLDNGVNLSTKYLEDLIQEFKDAKAEANDEIVEGE